MYNPLDEHLEQPENYCENYNKNDGPELLEIHHECLDCEYEFSTAYSVKGICEKCGSENLRINEIIG